MELVRVRKVHLFIEEIFHEGGPSAAQPRLRGAVAVVMANPYAGRYEPDIMPFMEALKPLGVEASRRLVAALGNERDRIDAYGKATIIGAAGGPPSWRISSMKRWTLRTRTSSMHLASRDDAGLSAQ